MASQLVKVFTRRTSGGPITMWGTLHISPIGAVPGGWVCDSWTEVGAGDLILPPKMHWVPKGEGKFYHMRLNVDRFSTMQILGEDAEIDPRRAQFIRETLAKWETEFLASEMVSLG